MFCEGWCCVDGGRKRKKMKKEKTRLNKEKKVASAGRMTSIGGFDIRTEVE